MNAFIEGEPCGDENIIFSCTYRVPSHRLRVSALHETCPPPLKHGSICMESAMLNRLACVLALVLGSSTPVCSVIFRP